MDHLQPEVEAIEAGHQIAGGIDEERTVADILPRLQSWAFSSNHCNPLLLAALAQEQHGELGRSCVKQPGVVDIVRVGLDDGVQPVALVVDATEAAEFVQ